MILNRNSWQSQNLLGFWPLTNHLAISPRDLSSNNRHGVYVSAVPRPGPFARGLVPHFDADGESIDIDLSNGIGTLFGGVGRAESFTVLARCKGEATGARRYVYSDHATYSLYWRTESDDTWSVTCRVDGTNTVAALNQGTYAADTEYFLAAVVDWDAEQFRAYINGDLLGQANFPATPTAFDAGSAFAIGAPGNSDFSYWRGDIWDLRVYRGALSLAQIREIYKRPYDIIGPQSIIVPLTPAVVEEAIEAAINSVTKTDVLDVIDDLKAQGISGTIIERVLRRRFGVTLDDYPESWQ